MRNLHFIEQDHILQFCRISDYCPFSHDRIATDKRAMSDLCFFSDDRRSRNGCAFCYFRCFGDPDIPSLFFILLFAECISQFHNKSGDFRKHFPRIGHSLKNIFCNCLIQCIKFFYCQFFHKLTLSFLILFFARCPV